MKKQLAVYNLKLTVRSDEIPGVGLTNDEIGEAAAEAVAEAIAQQFANVEDPDELEVNVTSIERTDD